MNWAIRIIFIISIGINGYFIYDEMRFHRSEEFIRALNRAMGDELSKTTWKQGLELFTDKLKNKNKSLLNKKYYYINVWTSWCMPCIKEMPWLDSLAGTLKKDVGYIFVSDVSDAIANSCLKRRNYNLKNFIFLNNMNDFISAICNEKGSKSKIYPMVLIINKKGQLLHYSTGAYENIKEASEFTEIINNLP